MASTARTRREAATRASCRNPHRCGAGVVGLALHIDAEPTLTDNTLHNTDGIAALLEDTALLNMQLQKSGIGLI